jgi:hypothetical protein
MRARLTARIVKAETVSHRLHTGRESWGPIPAIQQHPWEGKNTQAACKNKKYKNENL